MFAIRTIAYSFALLGVLAFPASAEEASEVRRSTVAVLGMSAAEESRSQLDYLETTLLEFAANELDVLNLAELRLRNHVRLDEEERRFVPEHRAAARAAFLEFDFETARELLEEARLVLRERYAVELQDGDLCQLDFELARVLLDMNEQYSALEILHEISKCCPESAPGADEYPPRLIEAWTLVRRGGIETENRQWVVEASQLAEIGRTLNVTYIITGRLTRTEEDLTVLRLVLLASANGEILNEGRIQLGAQATWSTTLEVAVQRLLSPTRPPPEPEPVVGRLLILSTPSGASVSVDGNAPRNGTTPLTLEVSPGHHELTVTLDNHQPEEVLVNAWAHQTQPVEVVLNRDERSNRRNLWWVWTLIGVATAGAAAGLIYWGVTENQEQPDATVIINSQ